MLAQLGGTPERVLPIYYKHKPIWRGSKFYMNDEARWQNWEQNHFFQGMVPGWGISGIVLREEKATIWPI